MEPREFVQRLEQARLCALDPPWCADVIGYDWAALSEEERRALIEVQRDSLAAGVERLRRAARRGDTEARVFLGEVGVKLKPPPEDVLRRIRQRADRAASR